MSMVSTVLVILVTTACGALPAITSDIMPERNGATLHVSKRGDNSDGSSWAKAFHTIQQAARRRAR